MNSAAHPLASTSTKSRTGIPGFDQMTGGGVPRARTTLVFGGPGSGKTIFGLQFLAEGIRSGEPGIFVAFEEVADRIMANAQGFGWGLDHAVRMPAGELARWYESVEALVREVSRVTKS